MRGAATALALAHTLPYILELCGSSSPLPPRLIAERWVAKMQERTAKAVASVGAARNVSRNWSQETMTCHSFNCFSIVWGQVGALL